MDDDIAGRGGRGGAGVSGHAGSNGGKAGSASGGKAGRAGSGGGVAVAGEGGAGDTSGAGGSAGHGGEGGVPFDPACDCEIHDTDFSCTAPLGSSGPSVPTDCELDEDYVITATCDDGSVRSEWNVGGENLYRRQVDDAGKLVYWYSSGYIGACGISGPDWTGTVAAGEELPAAACSTCIVCRNLTGVDYTANLPFCDRAPCGGPGASGAGGEGGCAP